MEDKNDARPTCAEDRIFAAVSEISDDLGVPNLLLVVVDVEYLVPG